jgi:hypothetical protein
MLVGSCGGLDGMTLGLRTELAVAKAVDKGALELVVLELEAMWCWIKRSPP